jgi:hypothetical protein
MKLTSYESAFKYESHGAKFVIHIFRAIFGQRLKSLKVELCAHLLADTTNWVVYKMKEESIWNLTWQKEGLLLADTTDWNNTVKTSLLYY